MTENMNLHFMPDSFYTQKFISYVKKNFNINDHKFLIVTNNTNLRFINSDNFENISILDVGLGIKKLNTLDGHLIKANVEKSDRIYFHYLTNWSAYIINRYCKNKKLYWIVWGGDLYEYVDIKLYDKETQCLGYKDKRNIIQEIKSRLIIEPIRRKAIKKLDYVVTGIIGDYKLVKSNYKANASPLDLIYPNPVDFSLFDRANSELDIEQEYNYKQNFSKLIMLGNSGDPSNNHLTILRKLSTLKNEKFGVICPLSYGNKQYIQAIIKEGNKLLGDRFIPLINFIEPQKYSMILAQIDICIMNHNRQQGVGNMIPLIYLGAKLYIKECVTIYAFFNDNGIRIEKIENLNDIDEKTFFELYSEEQKNKNKNIIKERFSDENIFKVTQQMFNS